MWLKTAWGLHSFGDPGGIRTPDPRLRRPLLYPTGLLDHVGFAKVTTLYWGSYWGNLLLMDNVHEK